MSSSSSGKAAGATGLRRLRLERVACPWGEALLVTDERDALLALEWQDHQAQLQHHLCRRYGSSGWRLEARADASPARRAFEAYLEGELAAIDAVVVNARGTTFQQAVWQALRGIGAGTTLSYGALAARLGRPRAVRAVGLANGAANPVGVVVPCHRVIGADGSLTGYGGGLARKRSSWWLPGRATPAR